MNKYTHIDFLKDELFIQWQLTKDEELTTYWEKYLLENDERTAEFNKAVQYFSKIQLGDEKLSSSEKENLLSSIKQSASSQSTKPNRKKLFYYSIAASVAVLLCVGTLFMKISNTGLLSSAEEDTIVGESLNSEDILLITATGTSSFAQDINLAVDANGNATIVHSQGQDVSELQIGEKAVKNTLIVPYGKRSQLTLADGTKIWLNSGSRLEFPTAFVGKDRQISVTGEMYIEVAKDSKKPFLVNAGDMQVRVYGTKFNVNSYADSEARSVVLVDGSVAVKIQKEELLLKPNEMFETVNGKVRKVQVDASIYTQWKDGYLEFNNSPMTEVLAKIGRYYNLSFKYEEAGSLAKRTCTGKIYLSESVDNVMTTISLLSSTKFEKENSTIYIK